MKRTRTFFFATILTVALFLGSPVGADQNLSIVGRYGQMARGWPWSNGNQTWTFRPQDPDQSMCIFIFNNNPVSSHTFSLSVQQTGDANQQDFSSAPGRYIADTVVGTPSPVAAASMTSAYSHSNAASRVAIQISGAAGAAGTPDTFDLFAVQTNATSCGPVQTGGSSGTNLVPNATAQLQSVSINFSATGNNTIVAGVANQRVRVFAIFFVVSAATNVTPQDGAATALTGAMSFTSNGSLFFGNTTEPYFTTSLGNAFVLNQSGTAQVSGRAYYTQN